MTDYGKGIWIAAKADSMALTPVTDNIIINCLHSKGVTVVMGKEGFTHRDVDLCLRFYRGCICWRWCQKKNCCKHGHAVAAASGASRDHAAWCRHAADGPYLVAMWVDALSLKQLPRAPAKKDCTQAVWLLSPKSSFVKKGQGNSKELRLVFDNAAARPSDNTSRIGEELE
eukprot:447430-Rhodomonas_salina.2